MSTTYNIKFTPSLGSTGTLIEYREISATAWTRPQNPVNPTTATQYPLELDNGKSYYVAVSAINPKCTIRKSIITVVVPGDPLPCCPQGFILSSDGSFCYKEETTEPEIINEGTCLAFSKTSGPYSYQGAWLYEKFPATQLPYGSAKTVLSSSYWTGTPVGYGNENVAEAIENESVMNRDAVWVDTDCDGQKDSLTKCAILQFTHLINLTAPKTVYVGIGGDNTFQIDVNNVTVIQCGAGSGINPGNGNPVCAATPAADSKTTSQSNFYVWHIVPVELKALPNYLTFSTYGDGSINDALAVIIYDNTAEEIAAASSDEDLNIIFRTGDFKGQRLDIAKCEDGWQLDTTGGIGNYVCRKITQAPIQTC